MPPSTMLTSTFHSISSVGIVGEDNLNPDTPIYKNTYTLEELWAVVDAERAKVPVEGRFGAAALGFTFGVLSVLAIFGQKLVG